MSFGHEKLDVYKISLRYVGWVYQVSDKLTGKYRHARDQWLRAAPSIILNIAEGNGKSTEPVRRRFFEIARGSALECAAIQDVLEVSGGLGSEESGRYKGLLDRIVAMLTRLGGRGYRVEETQSEYGSSFIDGDADTDGDYDSIELQPETRGTNEWRGLL